MVLSCVCIVLGIHNPRVKLYFLAILEASKWGVLVTTMEPSKMTLLSGGGIAFDGGVGGID